MEDSTASYDLLYLTNHNDYRKVKDEVSDPNLMEDVKFYKERIIQQTIKLINNEEVTSQITNCFKKYLFLSVEHFKFIDKRDIIQKEYENIKEDKKKERPFNLKKTNKILEKNKQKTGKITDSLKITINHTSEKKIVYPKKKIINLKDDKFKTKGLEKKECEPILVENNVNKKEKEEKDESIQEINKKDASKKTTEKKKKKRKKKDITAKIYS
tara:strand:+ start:5627 stop:6265 length:639 start_codon:yes stop_codon:yes gene_type:complete